MPRATSDVFHFSANPHIACGLCKFANPADYKGWYGRAIRRHSVVCCSSAPTLARRDRSGGGQSLFDWPGTRSLPRRFARVIHTGSNEGWRDSEEKRISFGMETRRRVGVFSKAAATRIKEARSTCHMRDPPNRDVRSQNPVRFGPAGERDKEISR